MTEAASAVADAHRENWASMLAAVVRVTRDVDLAEECVQEAYASALRSWPSDGVPSNPSAWLATTARRRAVDVIRRDAVYRTKLALLVRPEPTSDEPAFDEPALTRQDSRATSSGPPSANPPPSSPATGESALSGSALGGQPLAGLAAAEADERLRLIFMCCHPALAVDVQPALTLRLVCGLSTADIARLFLVAEPTMAARLTRAKKKIAAARIPMRVPTGDELPNRLSAVLDVIHLLFTTGHTAPSGADLLRTDLLDQSLRLARLLRTLVPHDREVQGLLALLLATDARRSTRVDAEGRLLRLDQQDRSRWDRTAIAEAHTLIVDGLQTAQPGRYLLQAAIAALHAQAPTFAETDWPQILTLYDELLKTWPSPVAALNRLIPLSRVHGPDQALHELEALERDPRLATYRYLPAVKANLLHQAGRPTEATAAHHQAESLTANQAERTFLRTDSPASRTDP